MQSDRTKKDYNDMITFLKCLNIHNPFSFEENNSIAIIATRVVADKDFNVDNAIQNIHEKIDGKDLGMLSWLRVIK
jgi:hypothetical protein